MTEYPEIMTIEEAAAMLRITPSALRARVSRGEYAEAVIRVGVRRIRINREKFRAALGLA